MRDLFFGEFTRRRWSCVGTWVHDVVRFRLLLFRVEGRVDSCWVLTNVKQLSLWQIDRCLLRRQWPTSERMR